MDLQPIYFGFDGLDVTFQGRLPPDALDILEMGKMEAQATRAPALIALNGVQMHVAEAGAKGGYAYRVDTGPEGAVWFFSRNQDFEGWNIRVSAKSAWLATKGFGRVRAEMYAFLEAIGASVGKASIGRIDYCMDFRADDLDGFAIDPFAFVMHSRCNRFDHAEDMAMHGKSGRYTSVTVGTMPGRQVIVYDKTAEIVAHRKAEWPLIWAGELARQGREPLADGERVYRVELRAGKDHLKNRWDISDWADLDTKLGDVLARALADIRYTADNGDTNRSRRPDHPLWSACARVVAGDLFEMACGAEQGVIRRVRRSQLQQTMQAMFLGLVATWTLATGLPANEEHVVPVITEMTANYLHNNREDFAAKMKRAGNKYYFLMEDQGGQAACEMPGNLGGSGEIAAHFDCQGNICAIFDAADAGGNVAAEQVFDGSVV